MTSSINDQQSLVQITLEMMKTSSIYAFYYDKALRRLINIHLRDCCNEEIVKQIEFSQNCHAG